MPLVEIVEVTKRYQQGIESINAVDHLSLNIEKGDFVALVGPSGSGKTTLLNLIGALDKPSEGKILIEGRDLSVMSQAELSQLRKNRIGFVFQSYNLIPVLTAFENAEFVLLLQGVPVAERRKRVMQVLEEVGLAGLENRRPHEMSGGQQQRVAVARAIVTKPAIVLADEPTANLDSKTAEELLAMMRRMNEEEGSTFIFSTHDSNVMAAAKRRVVLKDGQIEKIEVATA